MQSFFQNKEIGLYTSASGKIVERWTSQRVWGEKICSTICGGVCFLLKPAGYFFLNCGVSEVCFFYWAGFWRDTGWVFQLLET